MHARRLCVTISHASAICYRYYNPNETKHNRQTVRMFIDCTCVIVSHVRDLKLNQNYLVSLIQLVLTIFWDLDNMPWFYPLITQLWHTHTSVKYIGLHIDENLNSNVHIYSLIMTSVKCFWIFNQLKVYISNQLARKLYNAFVYSNISYGIEVDGSCSDISLERLQVIQNKLLKLLLRLDPYTSTNLLHSELNILKVKDLYNTSLLLFVHANLQGDCPAAVKNYFWEEIYNTRQTGHLEYRRARLDLGTSRLQYHAAELWNLLSDVIKHIPCRKYFRRNLCEKLVQGYSEYFLQFSQGRCH